MNSYYRIMIKRKRLMPIYGHKGMKGFLIFYITNDISKYVNSDPYKSLPDNSQGKICYIAHLITDKKEGNSKVSYGVWRDFKEFIKDRFSSVETICWRRWDRDIKGVKTYSKRIRNTHFSEVR